MPIITRPRAPRRLAGGRSGLGGREDCRDHLRSRSEEAAAETEAAANPAQEAAERAKAASDRAKDAASHAADATRLLSATAQVDKVEANHAVEEADTAARDRYHDAESGGFPKD